MRELLLAPGVRAIAPGFAFIERTGTLITADAHFGYEEAIGSALPAWSTNDMLGMLLRGIRETQACELAILGDIVHSPRLSDGMAATVRSVLNRLREACALRLIAGNHEGRGRARDILGEVHETIERDGWTLLHGDVPAGASRSIIGHIHPSLPVGGSNSVPVFLSAPSLIVVPALTPYSSGLSATSAGCLRALRAFGITSFRNVRLSACTRERLYAFGSIGAMLDVLTDAQAGDGSRFRRRALRADR